MLTGRSSLCEATTIQIQHTPNTTTAAVAINNCRGDTANARIESRRVRPTYAAITNNPTLIVSTNAPSLFRPPINNPEPGIKALTKRERYCSGHRSRTATAPHPPGVLPSSQSSGRGILIGGYAEEAIDRDEAVALVAEPVDDQLHRVDGGGPVAAFAITAVMENDDGAGAGDPHREPSNAFGTGLSHLERVAELAGHHVEAVVLEEAAKRGDPQQPGRPVERRPDPELREGSHPLLQVLGEGAAA